MSKFQMYKDAAGKYRFRLRAGNNRIVAVGEAYEQRAGCLNGIRSVQKNCVSPTEDLTIEGGTKLPNPKYQMFQDAKGKFRFHLKAANGEIIAQGEGYESREACLNGIEVVRGSKDAEIQDLSVTEKPGTDEISGQPEDLASSATASVESLSPAEPDRPKVESKIEAVLPEVKAPEIESAPIIRTPDLERKVEAVIPEAKMEVSKQPTISPVRIEPNESIPWESKLELYPVSQNLNKGAHVTFRGKLSSASSGRGVPDAKIRIFESDKSILGDDYLAFGKTMNDGVFTIVWKARSLSWRKNSGNIYATFAGNEKAKPAKSEVQTITIT